MKCAGDKALPKDLKFAFEAVCSLRGAAELRAWEACEHPLERHALGLWVPLLKHALEALRTPRCTPPQQR